MEEKLIRLWDHLLSHGFICDDYAIHNIAIDEYDNLQWIDLDSFRRMDPQYDRELCLERMLPSQSHSIYQKLLETLNHHITL